MPSIHREICEVCLKSDVLCPACEEKFEKGRLEKIDIEVARFLESLKEKFKVLRDAKILKVFKTEENIIIIAKKGDAPKLIGKNGAIVKILSKEFKKPVKIVEYDEDIRKFLNNLVFPASIEGVNIVYGKNGETKYKIRVTRNYARKIDKAVLIEAVEITLGARAEVMII